ncbi:MAG: heat-inducible transcriptional repressor HrcA [Anaerovoracaceae bacterium]|nr:heat-inducible transcriptional repressor HrcA [Bacillota bacterium]MDD7734401.1 heat-inducible transcriptional repressor HrcA [Bacillota bacterium]MDY5906400.1 heat-inducible transcriptional repressor HrcA [Anaerovoracaceae bacterium]
MDLTERKLKILQAIVGDFIYSAEPVGSRTISRKYDMGVSAATIRNEMSDLEDMGFLTHPHTSAGRIPSDKAYRLYVNSLMKKYELPEKEKQAIEKEISENMTELDKTIQHASNLLSRLTNLTAFAMTPNQDENKLKYVNILPVDERTVVLMIVAESGKVTNTAVRLKSQYDPKTLELLSKVLTHNYRGRSLSSILTLDIIKDLESDIVSMGKVAENIIPSFISTLENMLNVDLYIDGLENIFSIPEYNDINKAKVFMNMVSRKQELTKLLMNRKSGVIVTIGNENDDDIMKDCSLITATYCVDGHCVGKLGVVGPTRMKYDEVTSVVEFLTQNLNSAFKLTEGEEND